jgi:hypothetical protein
MRYRVTGYDRSGSNLFSRVVEAMGPDHAKVVALVELRKSFAEAHLADKAERLEVAAEREIRPGQRDQHASDHAQDRDQHL